jgi:hypothetical protein
MEEIKTSPSAVEPEERDVINSFVGSLQGQQVNMENSGAAFIQAQENITVNSGGGMALISGHDMSVNSGVGQVLVAGRDMSVNSGGGQLLVAGNNLDLQEGGGGIIVTRSSKIENSTVGFLISRNATLDPETKVMFNTPQAAAFGLAAGAGLTLVSFLLRRLFKRS